MTVIVAFVGPDGAVIAADTEATESSLNRFDVEKIWTVGSLAFGYSGTDSIKQPLMRALEQQLPGVLFVDGVDIDRWDARNHLVKIVGPVLREAYSTSVAKAPGRLTGALLAMGRDEEGYWLLELNEYSEATAYEEHGFHTVGSGSSAAYVAHTLMSEYDSLGRTLAHLKLIAYRTVQACIDSLSGQHGIGGEVRLWHAEPGRAFAQADDTETDVLRDGLSSWRQAERETLDKVIVPPGRREAGPQRQPPELPARLGDLPAS